MDHLWSELRRGAGVLGEHKYSATVSSRNPKLMIKVCGEQPWLGIAVGDGKLQRWLARNSPCNRGSSVLQRSEQTFERSQINILSEQLQIFWQHNGIYQLGCPNNAFIELNLQYNMKKT